MIDDNPFIMELNREALTQQGYRVLEAETISQGRSLFENEHPDLIMLEVKLPDGCGLRFCEDVRNVSDIPIMFVSVLGTKADRLAGLDAGSDFYMPKPYDLDVLLVRLKAILRYAKRHVD